MKNTKQPAQPAQPAPPRPDLSLVPKDRSTEQFPYGRQAVGQRADLPFTVGRR